MFNNNINKPAITVFCHWHQQKLFLPGRFFPRKKTVFTGHWQKLANPGFKSSRQLLAQLGRLTNIRNVRLGFVRRLVSSVSTVCWRCTRPPSWSTSKTTTCWKWECPSRRFSAWWKSTASRLHSPALSANWKRFVSLDSCPLFNLHDALGAVNVGRTMAVHTPWVNKKQDIKLLPITSPNNNRFSQFFLWQTQW